MTQFFNVQMNLQDTPQVQIEQSGTNSTKNASVGSEESFNSVLQKALPEKNSTTVFTDKDKPKSDNNNIATESSTLSDDSTLPTNIFSKQTSVPTLFQQIVQKHPENPISALPLDQSVLDNTETFIATLATGQAVLSETDKLIATLPAGQAVLNKTDKLIATLATDQAVLSESDKLIATLPAGQAVLSETDKLISTLPTGQAVLSETDTISITPKEIPVFLSSSTAEPTKEISQANLLSPLNTHTKNELNILQNAPSFGSGTKSLSDLQNSTTQTNNTSAQRVPSELALPSAAISSQQVITPQQGVLLDRLSTIINNGAETGILSIKRMPSNNNDNSLRSQLAQLTPRGDLPITSGDAVEKMTVRGGDTFTALEDGIFAPSLRNKQQNLSGIRQDSNQQYFNAKVQPQNSLNDSSNPGTNQQNEGTNQQSSGFNQLSPNVNKPEAGTPFTLQGTAAVDPLSTQFSTEAKTTVLPSGTLLHDQEVMQQLVKRFQVNRRQLESKIQLKLHPAELGKMEIDLTVKEGSIRANVVAQSQHVQEIVERNIAKLKSVLEQQGFNVEEITVTSESEMVGSFDLFDQHFSNTDSSTLLKNNNKSENNTPFDMDEFQDSYLDASTGVNVKV